MEFHSDQVSDIQRERTSALGTSGCDRRSKRRRPAGTGQRSLRLPGRPRGRRRVESLQIDFRRGRSGMSAAVCKMQEQMERNGPIPLRRLPSVRERCELRLITNVLMLAGRAMGEFVELPHGRRHRTQDHRQRQDRQGDQAQRGRQTAAELGLHDVRIPVLPKRTIFHFRL